MELKMIMYLASNELGLIYMSLEVVLLRRKLFGQTKLKIIEWLIHLDPSLGLPVKGEKIGV